MKFSITSNNIQNFIHTLKKMGIDTYVSDRNSTMTLSQLQKAIHRCRKCPLAEIRTQVVFGEGNHKARIVFVGEAPGEGEDLQGRPFVGRAGKLLDQLIARTDLTRDDVYICNVLKCRPPDNRDPEELERDTCKRYLFTQLEIIKPEIICTLSRHAYNTLLGADEKITRIRGKLTSYNGTPLLPTYRPSFLLRNEGRIKEAWEDMESLKQFISH